MTIFDKQKNKKMDKLTEKEKQAIRVLNYIATFDGLIINEDDIRYLLNAGIDKFIFKKRQHLVSITEKAYPISINIRKNND